MKKVLKKFLIVVSVLLILFSIYGGVTELTAEKTDTFGIVLAVIFFFLGAFLLFLGIRRKKVKKPVVVESEVVDPEDIPPVLIKKQTESAPVIPEPVESTNRNKAGRSVWPRTALIVSAWVELVFFALGIVFALIFGVAGFKAGEMGAMVGILMVMAVIGITIIVSVRIVALWGLVKRKSWAPVLNLILMAAETVLLLVSGAWPVVLYTAFSMWCSVYLIRHKSV